MDRGREAMRVLWFTGVQLPAVTGNSLSRAGWQEGLRRAIMEFYPEVELGIASFGSDDYSPFRSGNTTYFNIYRDPQPQQRLERFIQNWKHHQIQTSELDQCLQIVKEFDPELVYIFGTENPFGLLCNRFSMPSIISIQAVITAYKNWVFSGLPLQDVLRDVFHKKFLMGKGLVHKWWRMQQQARMERRIFTRCSVYDGRTDWDKKWLKHLNPGADYYHIDRVLGDMYYGPTWDQNAANQKLIFTTSSNAAFKGGVTLARAMIELMKRGREDIQLRMAGIHPLSRVGKSIKRLTHKYHVNDQITLLGRIPPEDIVGEMRKASLFVLPSHIDNSPNSLAEAMMMGIPCIASDAGGIPSMMQDGKEGLIYPRDEVTSLADMIVRLIEDPAYAQELGENARKRARPRHDPQRIAGLVTSMYREVLAEGEG